MTESRVAWVHRNERRRTLAVLVLCLFATVLTAGCDEGWVYSAVNDSNASVTIEAHLDRMVTFVLPAHSWAYVAENWGDFDRSWTIGTVGPTCHPLATLTVDRPKAVFYIAADGQPSFSDGYLPPYEYGLRTAAEITPNYAQSACPTP